MPVAPCPSTRRSRRPVGSASAIIASALVVGVLAAQTSDPQQPVFRAEANFVRVDVYPTQDGVVVADLRAEDFEILEDGVPQRIETFELVRVAAGPPPRTARAPSTVAESLELVANARARVVVVFLDTYHVSDESSQNLGPALANTLRRELGPDDLVAVMTPDMRASDLAFGRSTDVLERVLANQRSWGRRGELLIADLDAEEQAYRVCYPPDERDNPAAGVSQSSNVSEVAWEMIQRRRERRTLDAFDQLVAFLGTVREERKAVLTVSEGWVLFRANERLGRALGGSVPGRPGVVLEPGGTIRSTADRGSDLPSRYTCDADRMELASVDSDRDFRRLLDRANRANVSFYSVDPRGLATHDTMLTEPLVTPSTDRRQLGTRQANLRVLAEATDGIALVDRGDLARELPRIFQDLSTYYLLGYYSTNTRLDGSFRRISVNVARPGIAVRARRGYRAATREEIDSASAPAAAAVVDPGAEALEEALGRLAALDRSPEDVLLRPSATWSPATGPSVWLIGELAPRTPGWRAGGRASVVLMDGLGQTRASATEQITPGSRSLAVRLSPDGDLSGSLSIEVRLTPADGLAEPIVDSISLRWPEERGSVELGQPVYFRALSSAAAPFAPTASPRFRRTERVRVEIPVIDGVRVTATARDRRGGDLGLPVETSVRTDDDGTSRAVAELRLAPLAPGDYVLAIELASEGGQITRLVELRIVP